jgi:hypothetical protein
VVSNLCHDSIPLTFAKLDCNFIVCRNDPKNFFNSPQELMDAFKEIVEQRIEPKLLKIFHSKPSSKLEIVEVTLWYTIILDYSSFFSSSLPALVPPKVWSMFNLLIFLFWLNIFLKQTVAGSYVDVPNS